MSAVSGKGLLLPNKINPPALVTGSPSKKYWAALLWLNLLFLLCTGIIIDWMPLPRLVSWHLVSILTGGTTQTWQFQPAGKKKSTRVVSHVSGMLRSWKFCLTKSQLSPASVVLTNLTGFKIRWKRRNTLIQRHSQGKNHHYKDVKGSW